MSGVPMAMEGRGDDAGTVESLARLSGVGRIYGKLVSSGVSALGNSPGLFTVNRDVKQRPDGELKIELAGSGAALEPDRVLVQGTATLDGTMIVTQIDGLSRIRGYFFYFLGEAALEALAVIANRLRRRLVDLAQWTEA